MITENILDLLCENLLFKGIDLNELKQVEKYFSPCRQYEPGQIIIKEGDIGDEMYLIIEGHIQISKKLATGEEMMIRQMLAGEFFGELALIEEKERSALAYCVTHVKLIPINKDNFFSMIDSIPRIYANLARIISERLRSSDKRSTIEVERTLSLIKLNKTISDQKKELEAQKLELQEMNATKDKFFSIISHDLKNHFYGILGYSELLMNKYEEYPKEKSFEYIKNLNKWLTQLYKLMENLLQWSRLQTGKIQYNPDIINLNRLVDQNITLCYENAKKKEITLRSDIYTNTFILGDRFMLNTIFRNLISNAIKFTNNGGQIIISSQDKEDCTWISVVDTGIGIRKEDISKLFRIDVPYTSIGTSNEEGTGLGLILCKEFIEKQGGKIWIESEFGKGSSFIFSLQKTLRS
ncbi:MAG: cyclic nucleotide-binding domain-containing protein [Desulfobacterales bacterium]|nr:cyclic nucleotide-binding domain-containing protein [Desulfobacterales bacterium]